MESNEAWKQRWSEGRIGFHQDSTNGTLVKLWAERFPEAGSTVLVPLCGKSGDMLWLARRGHRVLGVEVVEQACRAFFEESGIPMEAREEGRFTVFRSTEASLRVELWCGDFFDLRPADVGELRACYDRAALVALPPETQERYARHLAGLLDPGAGILTLTFDYPQEEREGPPFAVSSERVVELFGESFEVDLLETIDRTEDNRWELSSVVEPVLGLCRRAEDQPAGGLAGYQRKYLRGLAHSLKPTVQVGKAGVTDEVIATVNRALEDHELIKVSMHKPKDKRGMSVELASASGAELCGLLGHTAILYRARKKRPQIRIPTR